MMGLAVRVCVVVGLWWVCIGGSASLELARVLSRRLARLLCWLSRTETLCAQAGRSDMRSSLRALSGVLVMIGA